jgi:hypothetical protein
MNWKAKLFLGVFFVLAAFGLIFPRTLLLPASGFIALVVVGGAYVWEFMWKRQR